MSIKLNNFDYDTIENYYQKNLIENNFWIFGSNALETTTPISVNTAAQETDFLGKTIFGSKIGTSDFTYMLASIFWEQNTIYTAYDDTEVLTDKKYYTVIKPVIESGNYHIFKCISNNNNSPSLTKPEFNSSINLLDGLYSLNDGYVWKYMTSVPFSLYKKFATRNYIPLIRNLQVETIANDGIYSVLIENIESNSGYEELNGSVLRTNVGTTSYRIFVQTATTFQQLSNTYADRVLYVEKYQPSTIIGGRTFKIISSGSLGVNEYYIDIEYVNYENFSIESGDIIKILPQIKITGDGTGAIAIPIFDNFSKIVNIELLNPGIGYTKALAEVVNPRSFDVTNPNRIDVKCILRPVISPPNGHGSNIIKELNCKHIGISKGITSLNQTNIPSTNKYSKIGLVKNPVFGQAVTAAPAQIGNTIRLVSIDGIAIGQVIQFINAIPANTTITAINTVNNTVTLSARTTAVINQDEIVVFAPASTFDNRLKITTSSGVSDLVAGDPVSQINPLTKETILGVIHEVDSVNGALYIIEYDGPHIETFKTQETVDGTLTSLNLLARNISRSINTIEYSPYQSGTGSVLFVTDFTPVNRTTDKIEQIKLVIDF